MGIPEKSRGIVNEPGLVFPVNDIWYSTVLSAEGHDLRRLEWTSYQGYSLCESWKERRIPGIEASLQSWFRRWKSE